MATTAKTKRGKSAQSMDTQARLGAPKMIADFDVFAEQIEVFAKSMRDLMAGSRLNKRAILVLIHDSLPAHSRKSGKILGIKELEVVLERLQQLDDYLLR